LRPLSSVRFRLITVSELRESNIHFQAASIKRWNQRPAVDWRDNEDGFARTTIESGARVPVR